MGLAGGVENVKRCGTIFCARKNLGMIRRSESSVAGRRKKKGRDKKRKRTEKKRRNEQRLLGKTSSGHKILLMRGSSIGSRRISSNLRSYHSNRYCLWRLFMQCKKFSLWSLQERWNHQG